MSAKVLPSSDASRQKPGPGILTPTSDISLNKPNHGDIPVQLGKGRPSGSSLAMEDLLKPTIVVRVGWQPVFPGLISVTKLLAIAEPIEPTREAPHSAPAHASATRASSVVVPRSLCSGR